mmetsp:Transcript_71827/g.208112  ORF Transcript_71827/g.208112 Transcript_71827/m.208112 type:complete len:278 (-) Transcript_71827:19-852(-)
MHDPLRPEGCAHRHRKPIRTVVAVLREHPLPTSRLPRAAGGVLLSPHATERAAEAAQLARLTGVQIGDLHQPLAMTRPALCGVLQHLGCLACARCREAVLLPRPALQVGWLLARAPCLAARRGVRPRKARPREELARARVHISAPRRPRDSPLRLGDEKSRVRTCEPTLVVVRPIVEEPTAGGARTPRLTSHRGGLGERHTHCARHVRPVRVAVGIAPQGHHIQGLIHVAGNRPGRGQRCDEDPPAPPPPTDRASNAEVCVSRHLSTPRADGTVNAT